MAGHLMIRDLYKKRPPVSEPEPIVVDTWGAFWYHIGVIGIMVGFGISFLNYPLNTFLGVLGIVGGGYGLFALWVAIGVIHKLFKDTRKNWGLGTPQGTWDALGGSFILLFILVAVVLLGVGLFL